MFQCIQNEFIATTGFRIGTECWQMICACLSLEDKVMLAQCSKFFHDEVVFGPNSAVFAWRDGVRDVATPSEQMICDAVRKGASTRVIGVLVKANADPNQQDESGEPVLVSAASWGHVETVRALLAAGADVDGRNRSGSTALMWATGYPQVMDVLLEAGADVNAVNNYGETALLYACMYGYEDTVRRLLAAHANVNIRDNGGWTILRLARNYNRAIVIHLLLEHGAVE